MALRPQSFRAIPPLGKSIWCPQRNLFPYLGCQQVPSGAFAGCRQILHRRLPGMAGEREFGIVCGQDIAGPQIRGRLRRFVRQHVDAVPLTVVLAVFQQG